MNALRVLLALIAALTVAACTQEKQNEIRRSIQNWTGTDGVLDMIPNAKVSVVGLSRNHETLQPEHYFERFVGHLDERTALIVDPMLATAGSMIATVDLLKRRGCRDIRALVLVAAPEGIRALEAAHPDVRCWTAAIDSHLNEIGYIIPGLGDAGDKIFGTK